MVLGKRSYQEIMEWIYCNARNIDLRIWQYHFEGGSIEGVLDALAVYQNEDGGFGKGLEPDNWNRNSTPYTTLYAINILKEIDFYDVSHPIYAGIIRYLMSEQDLVGDLWRFSVESNDAYPHAPWWDYNEETNAYEGIGITAELLAFVIEFIEEDTAIYCKAVEMVKKIFRNMMVLDKHGDMGIEGYIALTDTLQKLEIEVDNFEQVEKKLNDLVNTSIEHDTSKWESYGTRPSRYIRSPRSKYFESNREIIDVELDYLISKRPDHDVWGITWTWFGNNGKYADEFVICENWWKSIQATSKLLFLRRFDRIDLSIDN